MYCYKINKLHDQNSKQLTGHIDSSMSQIVLQITDKMTKPQNNEYALRNKAVLISEEEFHSATL